MKRNYLKDFLVILVGGGISQLGIMGHQPIGVGYFIAVWCSRFIRIPLIPVMAAGIYFAFGFMEAVKYGLIMSAIGLVLSITGHSEGRTPVLYGGIIGSGIMLAMDVIDVYLENGSAGDYINMVLLAVTAFCLSIIFYKIMEVFQLPRKKNLDRERYREQKKDRRDFGTALDQYGNRMKNISDSFKRLARSVEHFSESCTWSANTCPEGELALLRQNALYKSRLRDSRRAMSMQLFEMSRILKELSEKTYDFNGIDEEMERNIKARLREKNVILYKLVWLNDRKGISEFIVTIKAKRGKSVPVRDVTEIFCQVFEKKLICIKEKSHFISNESETYRFREAPNFYAINGLAKVSAAEKNGEKVSGDNFSFMSLETGQTVVSISDGMGTGQEAFKESEMVLELIEELMESGFSEKAAIKLLHSLFIMEGEGAALATVDMGIIDMYSGVCDFLKLGAASTYLKRDDCVEVFHSTSMPLSGEEILDMETTTKKLFHGDFVIMMSDGIIEAAARQNKEQIIDDIILNLESKRPQDMADEILNKTMKELGDYKEDDITVMVTGVWNFARCS